MSTASLPIHVAALGNLVGFGAGAVLYGLLLVMTAREAARALARERHRSAERVNLLLVVTGMLGLAWNIGALITYAGTDFGVGRAPAPVTALAASALGTLPAVVVHSVLRAARPARPLAMVVVIAVAYGISGAAAVAHLVDAGRGIAPSPLALRIGTVGYLGLLVPLLALTRGQPEQRRAGWVAALAVFAVSALHLARHEGFDRPWYVELIAHHSSLPLALVILHQDYRFALGDVFLKRALALGTLLGLTWLAYATVIAPLALRSGSAFGDPRVAGAVVAVMAGVAWAYQWLRRGADWVVDRLVLGRAPLETVLESLAAVTGTHDTFERLLDEACERLGPVLSAREIGWWSEHQHEEGRCGRLEVRPDSLLGRRAGQAVSEWTARPSAALVAPGDRHASAVAVIPLAEPPRYALVVGSLSGGRRLLSSDLRVLEIVATRLARRGDALRLAQERLLGRLREAEASRLATEAELRALRAQLNPHFLFNALTTIGYLIESAPGRALETLLRLTDLLRRVLASDFDITTLGAEIDFVEAYVDIERARFEDRLAVEIDVPAGLRDCTVPPFIVQTLVENAIKHGIAPSPAGGLVRVTARREVDAAGRDMLVIRVSDTGIGTSREDIDEGRRHGIGLANLRRRLQLAHGEAASLAIESTRSAGTRVEVRMPLPARRRRGPVGDETRQEALT